MDVKCPGCYKITTVFSHAQGVVVCTGCSTILCQPTGGRAKLTEGKNRITLDLSRIPLKSYLSFQDAVLERNHTKRKPASTGKLQQKKMSSLELMIL